MKRIISLGILTLVIIGIIGCTQPTREAPPSWQEYYDLGLRYLSENNFQEALVAFNRAIEIDSKQAVVYLERGNAFFALGNNAEYQNAAISDYEMALKLDESLIKAYLSIADIYVAQGRYDDAIFALRVAVVKTNGDLSISERLEKLENEYLPPELDDIEIAILKDISLYLQNKDFGGAAWKYNAEDYRQRVQNILHRCGGFSFDGERLVRSFDGFGLRILKHYYFYYGEIHETAEGQGVALQMSFQAEEEREAGVERYSSYDGEWRNDMPNGEGIYIDKHCDTALKQTIRTYDGEFADGLCDGIVVHTYLIGGVIDARHICRYEDGHQVLDDNWVQDGSSWYLPPIEGISNMLYQPDFVYGTNIT